MGRIGLGFLIGLCSVHLCSSLPAPGWSIALVAAFGAAAALRATLACALLTGFAWGWANAAVRLAEDLPGALEGEDLVVVGYVASLPQISENDAQFAFDVVQRQAGVPPRVLLTWYSPRAKPHPGELWRFTVRLKRRNGFANPGGFDYEGHLFRERIGAAGYVRDLPDNERLGAMRYGYLLLRLRAWVAGRLAAALGDDPMLGVVQGLAIGDTRAMQPAQWRVFGATGTTHLMAISGLHISMVAALIGLAGGAIVRWRGAQARGWNALHGQVIAGASAALAYSALAGLSIPTQRTLIMLCVYFAARWVRRELSVGHALGVSLVGVLLVDPFAPLTAGAWLSFGAVAVILLAVAGRLTRDDVIVNFTRVQLALTIGLTPFLLAAFGALSLISPLANAIAVPLFTLLIVPAVLIGALAAALSTACGAFVLAAPVWLLHATWPLFEKLARLPMALWYFAQPSTAAFVALVAGAALLVLPGLWPTRIAGALLCLPIVVNRPATPAAGAFELAVLDVGQGLASVVRTQSHVLVYDTGPAFRTGRDTGELVVTPYLRRRGVRKIDMLMISHGHLDHQGGATSVVAALPVEAGLRGPSVVAALGDICERGAQWVWDGVTFTVLHPSQTDAVADNDSSCVLSIRGAGGAALLTGDIEAEAEAQLVDAGLALADIVVAPHHGSRTSSTPEFVDALRPQLTVFSAGYRNRWGFPRAEIVERWSAAGARIMFTAESGAIEARVGVDGRIDVQEHRETHARYWRRRGRE